MTTGINLLDIAIPIILLLYFLAGVRSGFFTTPDVPSAASPTSPRSRELNASSAAC